MAQEESLQVQWDAIASQIIEALKDRPSIR